MNFFNVSLFDWLHCWIHGHTPVCVFRFTREKNGKTQERFRNQCMVCGKVMKKTEDQIQAVNQPPLWWRQVFNRIRKPGEQ